MGWERWKCHMEIAKGWPHQDIQKSEWEQVCEGVTTAKGQTAQCEGESPMNLNIKFPLRSWTRQFIPDFCPPGHTSKKSWTCYSQCWYILAWTSHMFMCDVGRPHPPSSFDPKLGTVRAQHLQSAGFMFHVSDWEILHVLGEKKLSIKLFPSKIWSVQNSKNIKSSYWEAPRADVVIEEKMSA